MLKSASNQQGGDKSGGQPAVKALQMPEASAVGAKRKLERQHVIHDLNSLFDEPTEPNPVAKRSKKNQDDQNGDLVTKRSVFSHITLLMWTLDQSTLFYWTLSDKSLQK